MMRTRTHGAFGSGGSVDINVSPSGVPPTSGGALPSFVGAQSSIPALTSAQASAYPTMPAATPLSPTSVTPQPFSNSVANVPVGGTSGAPTSPQIASIGRNGVPAGMPGAPIQTAQSSLTMPPGAKRGGRQKMANGGFPSSTEADPWYTRAEYRGMIHPEGLINSVGAGRTDIHNINVPSGSYIMPADVVSGLAEGNTLGGAQVMDRMMHSNPWGIAGGKSGSRGIGIPRAPAPDKESSSFASGGKAGDHNLVPIVVAGGEALYYPHTIIKKFGDLKKGHAALDAFVRRVRADNIKKLKKLPGPKT